MGDRHIAYADRHARRLERPVLMRVAPSDDLPVTAEEARLHLRLDHEDDDASLEMYLRTATEMLDGREGRLGRAILTQTWRQLQRQPSFNRVEILLGPNPQLVGLSYIGLDDFEHVLSAEDYRLIDLGDTAYVEPRTGKAWPSDLGDRPDALRITFTAGQPVEELPETIKQAIRLLVGHWYEQREATAVVDMKEVPIGVETLINITKVHGWAG